MHETSPWFDHYTDLFQLGDLLEFKRTNEEVTHYGIYIGESMIDGKKKEHCIVHLLSDPLTMFSTSMSRNILTSAVEATNINSRSRHASTIELDELESLLQIVGCRVRQNNTGDNKWLPMDKMKIVEIATSLVNTNPDIITRYELFRYECKQFANFCRYGQCDEMLICKKKPSPRCLYQKRNFTLVTCLIVGFMGLIIGFAVSPGVLSVDNVGTAVGYGFGGAMGMAAFWLPFMLYDYKFDCCR